MPGEGAEQTVSMTTQPESEAQLDAAARACAAAGARLTPLRRSVLALILGAETPLTAYQLLDRLRASHAGAVPPTIYRALEFLLDQKLIHRVESLNAFIPCVEGGPHRHEAQFLICRRCGSVVEIDEPSVSAALRDAAARDGFRADHAVVEITGTCAACAAQIA
jgi:Fur family zinc uptake transcriptional regulator